MQAEVLPRVHAQGYNCIQLMAVMEHAYVFAVTSAAGAVCDGERVNWVGPLGNTGWVPTELIVTFRPTEGTNSTFGALALTKSMPLNTQILRLIRVPDHELLCHFEQIRRNGRPL